MAYIDKDLLLKDIEESVVFSLRNPKSSLELRGAMKILDRIKNAPAADVVEVVKCGKCKYGDVSIFSRTKDGQEEIACYCNLKNAVTNIDSYCPSGRRSDT